MRYSDKIYKDCQEYLSNKGMSNWEFGIKVSNSHKLMDRVKYGRISLRMGDRIYRFIDSEYRPSDEFYQTCIESMQKYRMSAWEFGMGVCKDHKLINRAKDGRVMTWRADRILDVIDGMVCYS